MELFQGGSKTLVGMIHLPPLPGFIGYAGQRFSDIVDLALADARALRAPAFTPG